ncbi:LytR family transcriptional regulator [Candidatus Parcubacteria bacterium]|nr:MAG: LytR family transcriptional regulator [Candidatus Parcubacteria bacterium]
MILRPSSSSPKNKRPFTKKLLYAAAFCFVVIWLFSSQIMVSTDSATSWLSHLPIIKQLRNLAESADKKLKGEERGQINILLLGMGGKKHEGSYLTDTIILARINLEEQKIALISIPRDLSVPMEDLGWRKINNINALAEAQQPGSGGVAVSQAVSDLLSIPIDYYLRIDFEGFINIINLLGGLDVYVENTLNDYKYPIMGKETAEPYEARFEHLHIEKGWQKMDGNLALKYARSRHALGIEGSDFARARRQQKIILAAKKKLLSWGTLLNPKKIANILQEINNHFDTNLEIWEMVKLWNLTKDIPSDHIITKVLDNSPNGLLIDKISEEGAYILVPRSGDFSEVQYFVRNIFTDVPQNKKSGIIAEAPTLEIRNGTWINGLASKTALDLEKYGFQVVRVGNSSRQNFQKTVIYDLNYGAKPHSLKALKNILNANVSYGLPQWLIEDLEKEMKGQEGVIQPDFIIILGQEADTSASGIKNQSQ